MSRHVHWRDDGRDSHLHTSKPALQSRRIPRWDDVREDSRNLRYCLTWQLIRCIGPLPEAIILALSSCRRREPPTNRVLAWRSLWSTNQASLVIHQSLRPDCKYLETSKTSKSLNLSVQWGDTEKEQYITETLRERKNRPIRFLQESCLHFPLYTAYQPNGAETFRRPYYK